MATQRAESLRLAGRPWHAAEMLLAAAGRELHLDPAFALAGAKAELHARRYDRARGLLAGQPWLAEYADGEGLAVLAEAEARLGLAVEAATDYAAARTRAGAATRMWRCPGWRGGGARVRPAAHGTRARGARARDEAPRRRRRRPPGGRAGRAPGRLRRRHPGAARGAARRGGTPARCRARLPGRDEGRCARPARDLSPRAHPCAPQRPGCPRSACGIRPVVSRRLSRADRALRPRGHVRRPGRLGGRGAVVR